METMGNVNKTRESRGMADEDGIVEVGERVDRLVKRVVVVVVFSRNLRIWPTTSTDGWKDKRSSAFPHGCPPRAPTVCANSPSSVHPKRTRVSSRTTVVPGFPTGVRQERQQRLRKSVQPYIYRERYTTISTTRTRGVSLAWQDNGGKILQHAAFASLDKRVS